MEPKFDGQSAPQGIRIRTQTPLGVHSLLLMAMPFRRKLAVPMRLLPFQMFQNGTDLALIQQNIP